MTTEGAGTTYCGVHSTSILKGSKCIMEQRTGIMPSADACIGCLRQTGRALTDRRRVNRDPATHPDSTSSVNGLRRSAVPGHG